MAFYILHFIDTTGLLWPPATQPGRGNIPSAPLIDLAYM